MVAAENKEMETNMITIIPTSKSKFPLGHVVATPTALKLLTSREISEGLKRHANCDWGDAISDESAECNAEALGNGDRVMSAFGQGRKRFWIITEADRSVTTILIPEDY